FSPTDKKITADELWKNYEYFIKAVIPEAEKFGIKLALHPDDPPIPRLGEVERIMISRENIRRAVNDVVKSDSLGITMCQANYVIMGESLPEVIKEFRDKIFFIHFRNTVGTPEAFRETFHDNGVIDMAEVLRIYGENGVDVPIRVDHVPTMAGEVSTLPGYDAMGRMFAIGYLKGLLQALSL
ncbi:MAG: mannonate dehydratase, partial [Clostridia bacterium]|nr:mannonate dehydratase [Clostridia bacterium]